MIGSAGLGSTIGIALGSVLRRISPQITVVVRCWPTPRSRSWWRCSRGCRPAVLLGLTPGPRCSPLGKLSLDAPIQREIPERRRAGTFARSETPLQLAWVIGGFIGIALPLGATCPASGCSPRSWSPGVCGRSAPYAAGSPSAPGAS